MKVLDLFSGIGGFSLGLERAGMKTVAFCEIEDYPRRVLAKHWPTVPCYTDVREITKEKLDADGIGRVDVICGGFPCQPFSCAGKQLGEEDDRALWPEYCRIVEEFRPDWVIGENVAGFIRLGLDNLLSDLECIGYATRTFDIPACSVGALHQRRRVWIVANAKRNQQSRKEPRMWTNGRMGGEFKPFPWNRDWKSTLREFRGMDDGISYGVDRVETLRNAVVPQIPELIGRAIMSASVLHEVAA